MIEPTNPPPRDAQTRPFGFISTVGLTAMSQVGEKIASEFPFIKRVDKIKVRRVKCERKANASATLRWAMIHSCDNLILHVGLRNELSPDTNQRPSFASRHPSETPDDYRRPAASRVCDVVL